MKVSVVVPTKGRPAELGELLRALSAQTRRPDEVLVVDAASDPSAEGGLEEAAETLSLHLLRIEAEPGVCRQRNIGATRATGDVVFFFDDDVVPSPDYIERITGRLRAHPEFSAGMGGLPPSTRKTGAGALLCRLFMLQHEFGDGAFYPSGMPRHPYGTSSFGDTQVTGGGFLAVRKEMFLRDGIFFDESMPHSQTDTDFSYRLSRRGRIFFDPSAKVSHRPSNSGRPDAREAARRYMASYRYLYRKNFFPSAPWTLPFHWWAVFGLLLISLLRRDRDGLLGHIGGIASGPV